MDAPVRSAGRLWTIAAGRTVARKDHSRSAENMRWFVTLQDVFA